VRKLLLLHIAAAEVALNGLKVLKTLILHSTMLQKGSGHVSPDFYANKRLG
jgi:hypothetical protein